MSANDKPRGKPIALLFFALFNSILGLSLLFPILAPLGRQLGLTEFQVGSLSAGYAALQLVASPYWGRRSERAGRKPTLLIGIVGFAVSFFLFGLFAHLGLRGVLQGWPLYLALLAARIIGGALSSATMPTAQAYVADVTKREERTKGMAVIGAAFGLGVIFGPGIGAALAQLGLLVPVFVSAALAIVNALFVWFRLPEPERRELNEQEMTMTAAARKLWPLLLVALALSVAAVSMEQTVAFLFQDRLALSPESTARYVGAALVLYGVVAVFVQGVLVRRFPWTPRTLLLTGIPLAAVGLAGLAFASHFAQLTGALAMQGAGQGFAMPGITSAVSLAASDADQGAAAGLNSSAQALGRFAGPLIGTALYELNPRWTYLTGVLLLVVAGAALVTSRQLARSKPLAPHS